MAGLAGPGLAGQPAHAKEGVLLAFDGKDGAQPQAPLLPGTGGIFYGTTSAGGAQDAGTVFSLAPPKSGMTDWTEKVLFSFPGAKAAGPLSGLVTDAKSNLYGTTFYGGTGNAGTVFKLTPRRSGGKNWTLVILANFGDHATSAPIGNLVQDSAGNLYGATAAGGANFYGTIFEVSPPPKGQQSWTYSVLYNFAAADGSPTGGPAFDAAGDLLGLAGGQSPASTGNVYELTPPAAGQTAWTESIIYAFTGPDGSNPAGDLTADAGGHFYGAATGGGQSGFGTAFELSPPQAGGTSWTETTLFDFTPATGQPNGSLVFDQTGNLFGTSINGGRKQCGSVFRLSPPGMGQTAWTGTVLLGFSGKDGAQPTAGLALDASGTIYGTTEFGGSADKCRNELKGDGVVFALTHG